LVYSLAFAELSAGTAEKEVAGIANAMHKVRKAVFKKLEDDMLFIFRRLRKIHF